MSGKNTLTCFKTYDVRGKIGLELNEEIAYRIGRATVQSLNAKTVALGHDVRATSPSLAKAVARSICDSGADTLDIGLTGTEEITQQCLPSMLMQDQLQRLITRSIIMV